MALLTPSLMIVFISTNSSIVGFNEVINDATLVRAKGSFSILATSLSEPIYEKDGSSISMEERVKINIIKMWFEKIALEMEIDKLDEKEKLILYMRYQLDFNQERVAQRLNISQVQSIKLEENYCEIT